jgi:hypothetical protein
MSPELGGQKHLLDHRAATESAKVQNQKLAKV